MELANFLPKMSVIVVLEVVAVDFVFLPVVVSVVLVAVRAELM